MKILWITNVETPSVASYRGGNVFVGGWLDYSSKLLAKTPDIELHILSMSEDYYNIVIEGIYYHGFSERNFEDRIGTLFLEENYDLVHIWGTEYKHSLQAVRYLKRLSMLDKVVVSIQGLVSVYPMHFWAGLPYEIVRKRTFMEVVLGRGMVNERSRMMRQGELEIDVIKNVYNCIGRTDWDYACVKQINDKINYYKCNEILREGFYNSEWNIDKCKKYTISFSQCHYPIKGLHIMVAALAIIIRYYPDVKLKVVGDAYDMHKGVKGCLKRTAYKDYVIKLINDNGLRNSIEWIGNCDEQKMIHHYLESNVFVCASSIENSSNSIGEAMLLGVPVVASDVGGIKSLMVHNEEGLLYQADAPYMLAYCVMKIFRDEEFAKKIGKNARLRATKNHCPEKNTIDLVNIYKSMM